MLLKHKFIIVGLLVLVSMVGILGINYYKSEKIRKFSHLDAQISNVEKTILQLRRNEKDFYSSYSLKYQQAFNEYYSQLSIQSESLLQATRDAGLNTEKVVELMDSFLVYQEKFNGLVEFQKIIGISTDDGLRGDLHQAVNNAEQFIMDFNTQQLRADMLQLRINEKDFLVKQDKQYLENFTQNMTVFESNLKNSEISPFNQRAILKHMKKYSEQFNKIADYTSSKGLTDTSGLRGEMRMAVHTAETLLQDLVISMNEAIAKEIGSVDQMKLMTNIIGVGLMAVVLAMIYWISKSVLNPLNTFKNIVSQATTENDLRVRVHVTSKDEISQIAMAFNGMMENFAHIIEMVNKSSCHISVATEDMSVISTQTNDSIQSQQSQTQKLTAAMTEMSSSVNSVASDAQSAANATKQANSECDKGKQVVNVASSTMNDLASSVQNASNTISLLEDDSNRIGSVLDVIRGIAEQTNLLALNAAIEAARAGEQGRGFAVVADEVRTLAGRTQESTQEIQDMMESLQSRAQEAVSLMADSHQQTQQGVENTHSANEALDAIVKTVKEMNVMNTQITTATHQQHEVTTVMNESVVHIDQLTEVSSNHSDKISTASNDLATLAAELQSTASQFKV